MLNIYMHKICLKLYTYIEYGQPYIYFTYSYYNHYDLFTLNLLIKE